MRCRGGALLLQDAPQKAPLSGELAAEGCLRGRIKFAAPSSVSAPPCRRPLVGESFFMRIPHQLYHFSYTQLPQIKYHISNMANMTIMIWNFRAFFHVRSGSE